MQSLSIIIPNYNHARYLEDVIKSCFNQKMLPCEVIVVDDASTDNSRQILKKLSNRYKSLKIIELVKNQGVAIALNIGIEAANGDWLLLRAADDLCPVDSFHFFYKALEDHPDAGIITGDVSYFEKHYNNATREKLGRVNVQTAINSDNYLRDYGGNIIHGVSTFCRRSWIRSTGNFDPELYWHCDWFLLMALGLEKGFIYIPETLGYMRINPESYNAAGTSLGKKQTQVLNTLLLKLENRPSLLHKMLECGCLDFYGTPLLNLIKNGSANRQLMFKQLLQPPGKAIIDARSNAGHAVVFRKFITRNLRQLKHCQQAIAIYGAGGHTQQLLNVWKEFPLSMPCLILETKTDKQQYMNINLKSIDNLNKEDCKLVILSSKSYEPLLASTMKNFHPELPFLKIWSGNNE